MTGVRWSAGSGNLGRKLTPLSIKRLSKVAIFKPYQNSPLAPGLASLCPSRGSHTDCTRVVDGTASPHLSGARDGIREQQGAYQEINGVVVSLGCGFDLPQ